jgi:hypothetical protein
MRVALLLVLATSALAVVARADFNGDGHADYVLQNFNTHRTAIWYLNNNVFTRAAYGPTLPLGWNLVAPYAGGTRAL